MFLSKQNIQILIFFSKQKDRTRWAPIIYNRKNLALFLLKLKLFANFILISFIEFQADVKCTCYLLFLLYGETTRQLQ